MGMGLETIKGEQQMKLLLAILAGLAVIFGLTPDCEGAVEVQTGTLTRVTAYCPCKKCCGKFSDGITASGHKIQQGDKFVAADPNIPFGTVLIIPGYADNKPVPVLDRGGVIKGNKIDVFFYEKSQDPNLTDLEWSHQEALNWGVKWLKVKKVLEAKK